MTNNILIVDDEAENVELLEGYLHASDFHTRSAFSGEQAMEVLAVHGGDIDAIFLDRMMPGMDGLAVLKALKKDKQLSDIPVIFQTAKADRDSTLEGLRAGAYYHLPKPFDRDQALAIAANATSIRQQLFRSASHTQSVIDTVKMMRSGEFRFKSIAEAIRLSKLLGQLCPDIDNATLGLSELMINAVEHGNLAFGYTEKSAALEDMSWDQKIAERLQEPEYKDKQVKVKIERTPEKITFRVSDEGQGFDYGQFKEFSPDRLLDSHGRGIMIARATSFSSLEYMGCGNEVQATVLLH